MKRQTKETEKSESETEPITGLERVIAIPSALPGRADRPNESGKSTFAARHFAPNRGTHSDQYRAIVADDPNDQSVTGAAFETLHYVAGQRLKLGRLVVVDATSVKPQDRAALVRLAREHDVFPIAIVFDLEERLLRERNRGRPDRRLSERVIQRHIQDLRRGLRAWRVRGSVRSQSSGLQKRGGRHQHHTRADVVGQDG